MRRLGFVTRWTVIGAFDDEGKRGLETAYPPEAAIDLAARYARQGQRGVLASAAGTGRRARVRPPRRGDPAGARGRRYALALVEAPRDERVALWFGAAPRRSA